MIEVEVLTCVVQERFGTEVSRGIDQIPKRPVQSLDPVDQPVYLFRPGYIRLPRLNLRLVACLQLGTCGRELVRIASDEDQRNAASRETMRCCQTPCQRFRLE